MVDFRINIIADPSRAKTGMKEVDKSLDRTSKKANNVGKSLKKAFAVIATGVIARQVIGTLANFSQEMSNVAAITGATGKEFAALSDEAQRLGRTTRFTATQAAEGMAFLARAGFTATESLQAVEGTLKLAQAGGLGLGRAADIASNALTAFRLEVDQTARVVDVLALAAASSNTNVSQLGDALKLVAPIAAGLNVSIESTTAAISALSDAGLQGTLAGTGLRRVMAELESPSQKTSDALRDMSISADQVKVSQVGLAQALTVLRDAGIETGDALQLFGQRGGPAFEVLSNSIPKVVRMTKALNESAGTADNIATVMDDNLKGALLRTQSAFQGVILAAGDSGAFTTLIGAANGLAAGLNSITDNIEGVAAGLAVVGVSLLLVKTSMVAATVATGASTIAYIQNTIAATALTFSLGGMTSVALGAAAALRAVALASIANPFVLIAAGAVAAFFAIRELTNGIEDYNNALAISEGGELGGLTDFGKASVQLTKLNNRLAAYEERLAAGTITQQQFNKITESITENIDTYQTKVDNLSGKTADLARAAADAAEAEVKLNDAFERQLVNLSEERRLLELNASQRSDQITLLEKIREIEDTSGKRITAFQKARLGLGITLNSQLGRQAELLENIQGPQRELNADISALNVLLKQGKISGEEFATALQSMTEGVSLDTLDLSAVGIDPNTLRDTIAAQTTQLELEAKRASVLQSLETPLQRIQEHEEILRSLRADGSITLAQFNDEMRKSGEAIQALNPELSLQASILESLDTPLVNALARQDALTALYESGAIGLAFYNQELEKTTAILSPMNAEQQLTKDILDEIEEKQQNQALTQSVLNDLYLQGAIGLTEYNARLSAVGVTTDDVGRTMSEGLSDGFEKALASMTDVAGAAENLVANGFGAAEDALVEFAATGEADFSAMTEGILKDVARLLARKAILGLINSLTGGAAGNGGASGIASLFGGERAAGGPVTSDKAFLVGEQGPELFVPPGAGDIVTAPQTAAAMTPQAAAAPAVNVSVVNITDPAEITAAMNTPEGEQVILNIISKNRSSVNNSLG